MEIQGINREDNNLVYIAFRNVDGGGSITANANVCLAIDGNSVNGNNAIHPAATSLKSWIGIADKTVAINGSGRAQAFGYRNSVKISDETTSITITAGDALVPIATAAGLTSGGFNNGKYAVIAETLTLSQGQVYAKANIFAM